MGILDFLQPSSEQRPAVVARGHDLVVTAGAGAGKTRTLVARYLSLLEDGLPVRSVIAITFTRKAALEMRNRIRDRIGAYLRAPRLTEADRARWELIYRQMDAARIGTIHSLCGEIIRSHPAEAGVDPRFGLLDETQGALLRAEAVQVCLDEAEPDEALLACVDAFGMDGLAELLIDLLARRGEAAIALTRDPAELELIWRSAALAALAVFIEDPGVRDAMRDLTAIRRGPAFAGAARKEDALVPHLAAAVEAWAAIQAAWVSQDIQVLIDNLPRLAGALPKNAGRPANWGDDNPKPLIAAVREVYDPLIKPLLEKKPAWAQDLAALRLAPAIRRAFETAADRYARDKMAGAQLDFDDLESVALDLLERHPAALKYWRTETRAVLVDEYQDTNPRQARLARLLAGEPGRLFVVGDGKQAIYGFRGGDVSVIRAEKDRVIAAGGSGAHITVGRSYRAHQALLDGLNALLRPVLGDARDDDPVWKQAFEPLTAERAEPRPGFVAPHIELHLAIKGDGERPAETRARAAAGTARQIAGWVGGGALQLIGQDGQLRPLRYDDVAILCRAASSFKAYEDAFERAGIPYLTVGGAGFFERPEVRDVINLMRAIETPHDDAAIAGALRSPVFGVSDYGLALLFDRRDTARSAWAQLGERLALLEAGDRSRAETAIDTLSRAQSVRGRISVAELLKRLLDETGYLPALLGAGQARGRRNVEKLLATARASGTASLRVFLEYAEAMRDTAAREGEARAVAEGAVQIMTAHAAKGLEFPIVVLGDANRPGGGQRAHMLHPEWGLLLRLTDADKRGPFMRALASQVEDAKDAAEAGRLLYVAATRAAEKLVLSGELSLKKDGTPGSLGGWLKLLADADALPLAKRAIDHDPAGSDIREMDLTRGGVSVVARIYEPGMPELVRSAPLSEGAPDLEALPLVAALPASGDRRRDAFLSRVTSRVAASHAPAWVVGQLVHRAAQLWRVVDADPDWLKAEAQNQGLVESRQIDDAARRAIRILDRFARHPLYALLEGADERLHEVPFAYMGAGHPAPIHGIIDCLYRRGGRWHVVDFKTDHVGGQDQMRAKMDEGGYVDQVRQYAVAVEGLLGERPLATLCFLDVNGSVEVVAV